jgi:predicted nucleotidyltransferase
MALACGIDLVLELPFVYACASAERFARGGVALLQATGLDAHLVFGSECGDLAALQRLAGLLAPESAAYQTGLHRYLDTGASFPWARQQALRDLADDPADAELLSQSNNILAVEYLKAIRLTPGCRLLPLTIRRTGLAYRDTGLPAVDELPSATAMRQAVATRLNGQIPDWAGLLGDLAPNLPTPALAELMARLQGGPGPLTLEHLAPSILSLLRTRDPDEIEGVAGMNEGLGRRLADRAARPGAAAAGRLAGLLDDADTRRFTRTRIQRALIALLAGLRQTDLDRFDQSGGPLYLRVLGFSRRGRSILKMMRHTAELPLITRASDFLENQSEPRQRMAALDLAAVDLWQLAAGGCCGSDFDTPVVMR